MLPWPSRLLWHLARGGCVARGLGCGHWPDAPALRPATPPLHKVSRRLLHQAGPRPTSGNAKPDVGAEGSGDPALTLAAHLMAGDDGPPGTDAVAAAQALLGLGRLTPGQQPLLAALTGVGRAPPGRGPPRPAVPRKVRAALALRLGREPRLSPAEVCVLAWALARLGLADPPLLAALARHLRRALRPPPARPPFTAGQLSGLARVLAALPGMDDAVIAACCAAALQPDVAAQLTRRQIADVLEACLLPPPRLAPPLPTPLAAHVLQAEGDLPDLLRCVRQLYVLGAADPDLLAATLQEAGAVDVRTLPAPALADLLVLLGHGQRRDPLVPHAMDALLQADRVLALPPAPLVPVLQALAALAAPAEPLLAAITTRFLMPSGLETLPVSALAPLLQALAAVQYRCEPLAVAVADRLAAPGVLEGLPVEDAITVASSATALGMGSSPLLPRIAEHLSQPGLLTRTDPAAVRRLAEALAAAGLRHEPLLERVAEATLRLGVLTGYPNDVVVAIASSFAALGYRHGLLLQAMADHVVKKRAVAELSNGEVAALASAYTRLGVHNGALMTALANAVLDRGVSAAFAPPQLVAVLRALAAFAMHRMPFLSAVAEDLARTGLPALPPADVAAVAGAYAALNAPHPALAAALAQRVVAEPGFAAALTAAQLVELGWALVVLGGEEDASLAVVMDALSATDTTGLEPPALLRLHQLLVHLRLHAARLSASAGALGRLGDAEERCRAAATALPAGPPSPLHTRVLRHLGKLGEAARERAVLPEAGGYCVDAWLEHRRVAVLVADRPAFCQSNEGNGWRLTGTMELTVRHLQRCGVRPCVVPFYELREQGSGEKERAYLRLLLGSADPPADA